MTKPTYDRPYNEPCLGSAPAEDRKDWVLPSGSNWKHALGDLVLSGPSDAAQEEHGTAAPGKSMPLDPFAGELL